MATFSHKGSTGTGPGLAVEISTADGIVAAKPVMLVLMPGAGAYSVLIEGSPDGINWADWSQGGFTSSVAKRLELGVRFWRTNIIENGGTLTSLVGAVPKQGGGWHEMNNPTVQNVASV